MGTGTTGKPLSTRVEAPFGKAGWESSLEGARWAGRLGPVGAPLTAPPTHQVPSKLKAGVSARAVHAAGVADALGWRHRVFPSRTVVAPRGSCKQASRLPAPLVSVPATVLSPPPQELLPTPACLLAGTRKATLFSLPRPLLQRASLRDLTAQPHSGPGETPTTDTEPLRAVPSLCRARTGQVSDLGFAPGPTRLQTSGSLDWCPHL